MNVFAVVKDNVTAKDVAMRYGIKINRSGLACCPFHRDKTPSMKIDSKHSNMSAYHKENPHSNGLSRYY